MHTPKYILLCVWLLIIPEFIRSEPIVYDDEELPIDQLGENAAKAPKEFPFLQDHVCADILLIFDTSCSITMEERNNARWLAIHLLRSLNIAERNGETDVRVAAMSFSKWTHTHFNLANYTTKAGIESALLNMDMTDYGCRTHTHKAIDRITTEFFWEDGLFPADRPDNEYPDLVIFFGDGVARGERTFTKLQDNLNILHSLPNILVTLVVLENDFGKSARIEELVGIPTPDIENNNLFWMHQGETLDLMTKRISDGFKCKTPPGGPINDPGSICADIVFGFDISCSIIDEHKELARQLAMTIVSAIKTGSVHFSAFTFDVDVYPEFYPAYFGDDQGPEPINDYLETMNMNSRACRTLTRNIFKQVDTFYFADNEDFGDRDDAKYPDLAIFAYDGVTAPNRLSLDTINAATALKAKGVDILFIKLWNNRNKVGIDELRFLPSSSEFLIPGEEQGFLTERSFPFVVDNVLSLLERYYSCRA